MANKRCNEFLDLSDGANLTGCLKKNACLRLEAYNSSLEAAIETCRDISGFLRFSVFTWAQDVPQRAESSVAADINWNQHIIPLKTLVYQKE